MTDANGHTSTQLWNYGAANPTVMQSWDAMGYSKTYGVDVFGKQRYAQDELLRRTDYEYDQMGNVTRISRPVVNGQRAQESFNYDGIGNRIRMNQSNQYSGNADMLSTSWQYDAEGRIVGVNDWQGLTTNYRYVWDSSIISVGNIASGGWTKTTSGTAMDKGIGSTLIDKSDLFGRLSWHQDLAGRQFSYGYNYAGLLQSERELFCGIDCRDD